MIYEKTQVEAGRLTPKPFDMFDIVIIGAGPAGMSAALAAGRAKLKTLLIEKSLPGGEIASSFQIDNYLGYPEGILGVNLASQMEAQLSHFELYHSCEMVEEITINNSGEKIIKTDLNNSYQAKAVILCMGLEPKKLDETFTKKFLGRGISYCAPCDGALYQNKTVAVLGGGNCACYAADYLSQYAQKVYLIHNLSELKAVQIVKEKILNNPKIDIMWNSRLTEIFGLSNVEKVQITNLNNQQYTWIDVKGVFVYLGRHAPKKLLKLPLNLDEAKYIITDEYMRTNLKGVFAAGDIRSKQIRQIATAVADGLIAAINAEREIKLL